MKCQKCGVNEATTHIKTMINGQYTEYYLCPDCADKMGYSNMFGDFSTEFSNLLGSFFGNALPERTQATRCPFCGSTYNDIVKNGIVGCSQCYDTFRDELVPTIRRIHGNTTHCGKKSTQWRNSLQNKKIATVQKKELTTTNSKLDNLKKQLQEAIQAQEFEQAAKLRDDIKEMEG